ncbi:MAG: SUMF1/EgtB/PvdO family nonheme iron enzyme [Candidatus Cloacimonetes bacterium]|nr:SUMF1/EgtB/PvdO family nonheme iron enzyme [Candidatus Cloacimonadota bacterium]
MKYTNIILIITVLFSMMFISCSKSSSKQEIEITESSNIDPLILGFWNLYEIVEDEETRNHPNHNLSRLFTKNDEQNNRGYYPEIVEGIQFRVYKDTLLTYTKTDSMYQQFKFVNNADETFFALDGQIGIMNNNDDSVNYLYDYFINSDEGKLWLKAETTPEATLISEPDDFSEILLLYKSGFTPSISFTNPLSGEVIRDYTIVIDFPKYSENTANYLIQISSNPDFTDIINEVLYTGNISTTAPEYEFNSDGNTLLNNHNYYLRIKPNDGAWSSVIAVYTEFEVNIISPAYGSSSSLKPVFVWNSFRSGNQIASEYHFQLCSNETFTESDIIEEYVGSDTTYALQQMLVADNDYRFRVKSDLCNWQYFHGKDDKDFKNLGKFSTDKKVVLISPANNALQLNTEVQLEWQDIPSTSFYTLKIWKYITDSDSVFVFDSDQLTSNTYTANLEANQRYSWNVNSDIATETSSIRTFYTNTNVALLSPSNTSDQVSSTHTFKWWRFEDADDYQLQISSDDNFSQTLVDTLVEMSSPQIRCTVSNLDLNSTYYWRVKANNAEDFSLIWSFTTSASLSPLYPLENDEGIGILPYFEWTPIEYATSYTVRYSESQDFTDYVEATFTDTVGVFRETLEYNRTYYWKVKSNSTDWEEANHFTTVDTSYTHAVDISDPSNGSEGITIKGPMFRWSYSGNSDNTHYWITVRNSVNEVLVDEIVTTNYYKIPDNNLLYFNEQYTWQLYSTKGKSFEGSANFTTISGLVSGFSVSSISYFKVDLNWTILSNADIVGYEISVQNSSIDPILVTSRTINSCPIFNLQPNVDYVFEIRSYIGERTSPAVQTEPVSVESFTAPVIETITVQSGSFNMGNLDGETDEQNVHQVTLDNSFEMGKYEVTIEQFLEIYNWALGKGMIRISLEYDPTSQVQGIVTPRDITTLVLTDDEDCPIMFSNELKKFVVKEGYETNRPMSHVKFKGAAKFLNWFGQIEGYEPLYNDSDAATLYGTSGYRLPTEAEWEYTARYNDNRLYPWGDSTPNESLVNFDNIVSHTTPVGNYASGNNSLGISDLSGNVWEWCNDWYKAEYSTDPETNPAGPNSSTPNSSKVIRGGSWAQPEQVITTTNRSYMNWNFQGLKADKFVGFRIIKL